MKLTDQIAHENTTVTLPDGTKAWANPEAHATAVEEAQRKPNTCPHINVVPEVCDQTLGVACEDCNTLIGCCWTEHISERLWNRAVAHAKTLPETSDPEKDFHDAKPCDQDRLDYCFLCGEKFDNPRGER